MPEPTASEKPSIFHRTPDPADGWEEQDDDLGEVASPTAMIPIVDPTRP